MRRSIRQLPSAALAVLVLAGCGAEQPTAPVGGATLAASAHTNEIAAEVRRLAAGRGITPLQRPAPVRVQLVLLGRALAFDKVLSGNHDISCMTCHLPGLGVGDQRSLSIGQGATGLGADRVHPDGAFIPRNAPAAFNLHALTPLFWDGRVNRDGSGLHTPAGAKITPEMASVFEFGTLSALPLFPVLSREEMRATRGNELAAIADGDEPAVWAALMRRLGAIPQYRRMFEAAYPGRRFDDMTFAYASNAIAGFLTNDLAFNNSPWDRFLAGDDRALSDVQLAGAKNFMSAKCSVCHNGPAFSDNQFHNVAVAQLGPGEGDGASGHDDFGRARVTGLAADRYAFRTTPLRNVALTGPWGHDGAFTDLRAFVDHYSESDTKLQHYDPMQLEPLLRGTVQPTVDAILATRDPLLAGVFFTPQQIDEVTEFLRALTDPAATRVRNLTPGHVPSGLPIDLFK
ncbi:MAG: cytochrome c peroxidase [Gemmatimonadota bacterium]